MKLRIFCLMLWASCASLLMSQDIPISTNNEALYGFVDELAACRYITVNQVVKPYSRKQIVEWLDTAAVYRQQMTRRQREELDFYRDNMIWQKVGTDSLANRIDITHGNDVVFSLAPLGFYGKTEKMTFELKPILEAQFYNSKSGTEYHRSVGAALNLTYGHWAFYANAQEMAESVRFDDEDYLVNRRGANYKTTDYSDVLGGITYANDWISVGLVKDYVEWGTNENGANIVSDRAPSFVQFKLKVKPVRWFEFNYFHGCLVSDVIDSTESYVMSTGERRDVMQGKYMAANLFTIYPVKTLALSFGNSVIYSADNIKWQFVNPLMFYKSVDHTYNSTDGTGENVGQNSQMFFDVSFRGIKKVFLYYSLFVDELQIERWKHKDEHNFYSYKAGLKVTQLIPNITFGAEYTHTTPITYQHDVTTTTFESNSYNMGHYLRDNAEEIYAYAQFRPYKNLRFKFEYTYIRKGEEYGYHRHTDELTRHPFIEDVKFKSTDCALTAEYQLAYDMFFNLKIGKSNTSGEMASQYVPDHYVGKHLNIEFGANIGF